MLQNPVAMWYQFRELSKAIEIINVSHRWNSRRDSRRSISRHFWVFHQSIIDFNVLIF